MARNQDTHSYSLGDQWRGLGGALLTRFGNTGANYSQALVDEPDFGTNDNLDALPPEGAAQAAAEILRMQALDLASVGTDGPSASLNIQTRSGVSVDLKISLSDGARAVWGLKADIKASGPINADERAAIKLLADGLDSTLEGLGRRDAVALDLAGLAGYDHGAIASIDLNVNSNGTQQVLGSFALHLGDDQQSIALKGRDGDMHLTTKANVSLGTVAAEQRDAALRRTLDRIDKAGERGHVNVALRRQMKSAFTQLQTGAAQEKSGRGDEGTGGTPGHWQIAASASPASSATPPDA